MPPVTLAPPAAAGPARTAYERRRERLVADYAAIPPQMPVRLAKRTSNVFRVRAGAPGPGLDVSGFDGVLSIDTRTRTADVQGMTTYERLVEETLACGLMPRVVPELRTITLGGAVTGLGIESASFRNGCPHESVRELEVMAGDGRIVAARPEGEHAALYHGFPNSYGTLGYALRLEIELEPVRPFVHMRHVHIAGPHDYFEAVAEICDTHAWDGDPVDFLDGTVFGPGDHYLTIGTMVGEAPYTSDYAGRQVYYRSIRSRTEDFLTIRDYLWRWDTDWFWCSRAFGLQRPRLRRLWPRRWLRSDVYWRIAAAGRRLGLPATVDRLRGRAPRETVIQDVQVPIGQAARFLEVFHREVGMAPVWVCPLRARAGREWSLYPLDPDTTYVNFGFWGNVIRRPGERPGDRNRLIERLVAELGGRKSLYSTSYYGADEFRATYGGDAYDELKAAYDPDGRLLGLYEKCVQGR